MSLPVNMTHAGSIQLLTPKLVDDYDHENTETNATEIQLLTCVHRSESNVVSFAAQQQCSRFNQKASRHTPSFKSDIHVAPISTTAAHTPSTRRQLCAQHFQSNKTAALDQQLYDSMSENVTTHNWHQAIYITHNFCILLHVSFKLHT